MHCDRGICLLRELNNGSIVQNGRIGTTQRTVVCRIAQSFGISVKSEIGIAEIIAPVGFTTIEFATKHRKPLSVQNLFDDMAGENVLSPWSAWAQQDLLAGSR
ncbi:hypothetical protein C9I92_00225 [Photobacterium ganghwense]|uniref:Uncharacterized protein n=1 Tax=Photobacterium ganghwense TaxID=320778 RepID=A0A0J1H555_9GAMM|nr:hypothetical protein ABT57_18195 [Photobacterium ganghwense]PSU10604.1 hypothetical protein C9I92_00225 [Photobacterium ganghwense]